MIILGLTRLRQGQPADALSLFQEALRLRSDSGEAHALLASAHLQLGHFPQAIAEYDSSYALGYVHAWQYVGQGMAYESLGDYDGAVRCYELALDADPNSAGAREGLDHLVENR